MWNQWVLDQISKWCKTSVRYYNKNERSILVHSTPLVTNCGGGLPWLSVLYCSLNSASDHLVKYWLLSGRRKKHHDLNITRYSKRQRKEEDWAYLIWICISQLASSFGWWCGWKSELLRNRRFLELEYYDLRFGWHGYWWHKFKTEVDFKNSY